MGTESEKVMLRAAKALGARTPTIAEMFNFLSASGEPYTSEDYRAAAAYLPVVDILRWAMKLTEDLERAIRLLQAKTGDVKAATHYVHLKETLKEQQARLGIK